MLQDRFDSSYPFLLLPVRIETRFVEVERLAERPILPGDLVARMDELRAALDAVAREDLATEVRGRGRVERRRIKQEQEVGLYRHLDERLANAGAAAASL